MTVNNTNITNNIAANTVSKPSVTDSESRNLQQQITNAQQRLSKLSSDSEISPEEKSKKRQEIQKQIAELNRKLRQRRLEQKEEAAEIAKQEEKQKALLKGNEEEPKPEAMRNVSENPDTAKDANSPALHMQTMLTADSMLQQQEVRENIAREKQGMENILESEINSDTIYGSDTTAKREKLSEMRKDTPIEIKEFPQPGTKDPFTADVHTKIIIREK